MKNLATAIGIVVVLAVTGYLASQEDLAGSSRMVLLVVGPVVACAVFGLLLLHRAELLKPLLTFRPGDFTVGFVAAAGLFVGAFAATHYLFPLTSPRASWLLRLYLQAGDPRVLREHLPFVVIAIVLAAVGEEIVFRGVLPFLLEEQVGSRRAWLYSAVLYAVAQIPTAFALRTKAGWLNPLLPVAALLCGLLWGFITRRFGRLWPAIISHAFFDWAVVVMFRLYGPSV